MKKHAVDHQKPRDYDLWHGPFLGIHQDSQSSHKKGLQEHQKKASDLASKLEDITYNWSQSPTGDKYGLLAEIIGEDKYNHLTNLTWVQEVQPDTYITNTTATHTRNRIEQEWERTHETWAIRKGFFRGVAANFREALDKNWYSQLKSEQTAYRNTTPIQILQGLETRWCLLDVHAKKNLRLAYYTE